MSGELYRDINVLEHMMKYCNSIQKAIKRFNNDFEIFVSDDVFKNAVSMCMLQIGELVTHLTDEFKTQNKEIPWGKIVGMRNHFAHGYTEMDDEKIWETVQNNIPLLKEFCQRSLNEIYLNQKDVDSEYELLLNQECEAEEEL